MHSLSSLTQRLAHDFVVKALAMVIMAFGSTGVYAQNALLVVGDSLSAAYGIPKQRGWVELLRHRLAENGDKRPVVNASISGATSITVKNRLPQLLRRHKPSVTIVEIGANDGLRGLPLDELQKNLDAMVKICQQHNSKVLLVGMRLPPNYGPDYTEKFQALYASTAKNHSIAFLPFLMEGIAKDMKWMQSDGIHPTAAAQPLILRNVWPVLQPLL